MIATASIVFVLCCLFVFIVGLYAMLRQALSDIKELRHELGYKHSTGMAELDRKERRALGRKVDAIEHHLNITIKEEPAKMVVKKGGQHE